MPFRIKIKNSSKLKENKTLKTNCRLNSIDTEQEFEKRGSGKEAKKVPVWKQTKEIVCDLRKQMEESPSDRVSVDKKAFDALLDKATRVLDALDSQLSEESDRERQEKVFGPLMKTFHQLGRGIYQEKKNKKPLCSPRGMNPYHDADGEFSTRKDSKSWSVRQGYEKKNCSAGQRSMNPSRYTSVVCGRKNRLDPDVKAPNKCKKTNEDLSEVYDRWSELV
jgi:hypothetical protein